MVELLDVLEDQNFLTSSMFKIDKGMREFIPIISSQFIVIFCLLKIKEIWIDISMCNFRLDSVSVSRTIDHQCLPGLVTYEMQK